MDTNVDVIRRGYHDINREGPDAARGFMDPGAGPRAWARPAERRSHRRLGGVPAAVLGALLAAARSVRFYRHDTNMRSRTDVTATEPTQALDSMPLERLEGEITELAAHINAATARWLRLIAAFDRREGWAEWGCRSCTHWLSYRCGMSPAAAREHVRVARALGDLSAIRAAFGRGELCYSQVRAITRVATSDTEEHLAEIARFATAAQLETVVRAYRGVLQVELGADDPAHRRRWVRCEHDDDGSLLMHARLPADEGALVLAALEAGRDAVRAGGSASAETTQIGDSDPEADGDKEPGDRTAASNADALVLMADAMLSSGPADRSGGESHQVVVHVDASTLSSADRHGDAAVRGEDGTCELEHGPALSPETARRLACDASIVRILERDGRPLSVGRRTRSIPPALRRALRSRDRSCRFPGCCQTRFLHAHHLEHWAHGGRTDLSNLILLCSHHHRLVHEGGYTIEQRPSGALRFRRPDGKAIPAVQQRPGGAERELIGAHRAEGLAVNENTCVPTIYGDRFRLPWIVDGLAEADSRMRTAGEGPMAA
jgi:Domain of unknown function (DUF222)/HNH endonuclease